jgi:hypothetical protein
VSTAYLRPECIGELRLGERQVRASVLALSPSVREAVAACLPSRPPRIPYRVHTASGSSSCISAATTFSFFGDWPEMGDNSRRRRRGLPVPSLLKATGDRRCRSLPNSTKAPTQGARLPRGAFGPATRSRISLPESPDTAYTQFIGVAQHNLYHAGQISLLKRALGTA